MRKKEVSDRTELIASFVDCIIAEFEEAYASPDSLYAMKMPRALFQLLNEFYQVTPKAIKYNDYYAS